MKTGMVTISTPVRQGMHGNSTVPCHFLSISTLFALRSGAGWSLFLQVLVQERGCFDGYFFMTFYELGRPKEAVSW